MLELKKVSIYANDRLIPTIIITYITKENKTKTLQGLKMWLRKGVSCDYELINYANQLYYQIMVHQKQPRERDIFMAYQMLFHDKLWENYKESKEIVFTNDALNIKPSENYVEFHKDYMKDFVEKYTINYTKCVEKE